MKYGRYETLRELGRGSTGVVHEAYDPQIDRTLALKVLRRDRCTSETFVKRFLKEARTIGRLSHPNIVTVYDAGEDHGTVYIAMERLEGQPLSHWMLTRKFTVEEVIELGIQIAETLDYAHGKGVVHRDIKPSNIVVEPNGRIRITDFGIARMEDPAITFQTLDGEILGTPAYMSPEQVLGEAVDGRSDIFSLGVILYQLITGARPFGHQCKTLATLFHEITHYAPPAPFRINREINPMLSRVIMRCLVKLPEGRYPTGAALADALRQCRDSTQRGPVRQFLDAMGQRVSFFSFSLLILLVGTALAASLVLFRPEPGEHARNLQTRNALPATEAQIEGKPPASPLVLSGEIKTHAEPSPSPQSGIMEMANAPPGGNIPLNGEPTEVGPANGKPAVSEPVLVLKSAPSRARVLINGVEKGKTPLKVELPPGEHHVRVKLRSYRDWETRVELVEPREYPLVARMKRVPSKPPSASARAPAMDEPARPARFSGAQFLRELAPQNVWRRIRSLF